MKYTAVALASLATVAFAAVAAAAVSEVAHPDGSVAALGILSLQDPDGRALYLKNCRTCHGATGMPSGENKAKYPKIKALNDPAFLARLTDDSVHTVLIKGKGEDMQSWTDKLSAPEMLAVVKYVRTLPGKKK